MKRKINQESIFEELLNLLDIDIQQGKCILQELQMKSLEDSNIQLRNYQQFGKHLSNHNTDLVDIKYNLKC